MSAYDVRRMDGTPFAAIGSSTGVTLNFHRSVAMVVAVIAASLDAEAACPLGFFPTPEFTCRIGNPVVTKGAMGVTGSLERECYPVRSMPTDVIRCERAGARTCVFDLSTSLCRALLGQPDCPNHRITVRLRAHTLLTDSDGRRVAALRCRRGRHR